MKFDAELRMRYRTMKTPFFIYLSIIMFSIHVARAQTSKMNNTQQSEKIIRSFLEVVRSGKAPERAAEFMAATVIAHQMNAEKQEAIKRTPQNYTEHIKEFLTLYGPYSFEITELIASDNKVYARWVQIGKHLADIDQYKATGLPLTEIGCAVYRIENGKIVEYWIQTDRQGFEAQLQQNEKNQEPGFKNQNSGAIIIKEHPNDQPGKLPFSDAVIMGETVYISGQIGTGGPGGQSATTDFKAEANQVMKHIGDVLQKQNLSYNDLVSVTIYLTSMDNYSATNEVYQKYFDHHFPARVCIAVKELPLKARIEIAAIARKKSN